MRSSQPVLETKQHANSGYFDKFSLQFVTHMCQCSVSHGFELWASWPVFDVAVSLSTCALQYLENHDNVKGIHAAQSC